MWGFGIVARGMDKWDFLPPEWPIMRDDSIRGAEANWRGALTRSGCFLSLSTDYCVPSSIGIIIIAAGLHPVVSRTTNSLDIDEVHAGVQCPTILDWYDLLKLGMQLHM